MYLLLLIGLFLLVKGADYFVDGSSEIATFLNIPPVLIGLTIVAFGTSSPEAAVSIVAALKGSGDIALGNVVGSNIFNITFIIGITTILYPLKVEKETIRKEIPFTVLASIVLLILVSDIKLQLFEENLITRADGFVLLSFFIIFIYYLYEVARHSREHTMMERKVKERTSLVKHALFTIGGLFYIIWGSNLVVNNGIKIALTMGMSETLVGLTIVSIGTSLPELITSVIAAVKKKSEIALGNIVGSNIFNLLFVLGTSSAISPISVDHKIFFDIKIMILSTILLFYYSKTQYKLTRVEGILMVISYIGYMTYITIRN